MLLLWVGGRHTFLRPTRPLASRQSERSLPWAAQPSSAKRTANQSRVGVRAGAYDEYRRLVRQILNGDGVAGGLLSRWIVLSSRLGRRMWWIVGLRIWLLRLWVIRPRCRRHPLSVHLLVRVVSHSWIERTPLGFLIRGKKAKGDFFKSRSGRHSIHPVNGDHRAFALAACRCCMVGGQSR